MDRRKPSWHFDKKLSLDTLVAIAGVAVVIGGPLIVAWRSAETRILTLEVNQEHIQRTLTRSLEDAKGDRSALALQLKELGDKMTTLQIDVAKIVASQQRPAGRN